MKKSSEVFVFGKDVTVTPAGEGVERKVLGYSENMMICEIRMEKGAVISSHAHPHEQCSTIISGKCAYTVGAETKEVQAGDSVMVGSDVPHAIIALEKTLVMDAFTPMREDFI
ncbi:cupin domain-containing protein [Anaerotignum sp.]